MAEREFKLTFLGDSRRAVAAINDVDRKLGGLGGKVSGLTGLTVGPQGLAVAFGGALVGGIAASIKATAAYADEVEEMSQRTGLSTETIQELGHAAKITGTSIEGLEGSVKRMQRVIGDAEQGNKAAIKNLEQIGIAVEDIIALSPDEQFEKITAAIAEIEDPTKKASAAMDIFGRSGTDLLPMLDGGAEGMAAMREEAHKLGIVMDEEAVRSAAEFQDKLDKLQGKLGGLQRALGGPMIDFLLDFAEKVESIANMLSFAADQAQRFAEWVGRIPGAKEIEEKTNIASNIGTGFKQGVQEAAIGAIPGGSAINVLSRVGKMFGFDEGGVVPGPRGSAQLAVVHGGETILPTHKGGAASQPIVINIYGNPITSNAELQGMIVSALNNAKQRGALGFAS